MDELLLRYLSGGTTEEEDERVSAWLQVSRENRLHLESLELVLSLARAQDEAIDPGVPPRADDIIQRAGKASAKPARRPIRRFPRWSPAPLAVAAAAAFLMLGFLGSSLWDSRGGHGSMFAEELTTGPGESTTVRMSDGSLVRLGPDSRLEVMASESGRQVVLVGRAFFAVARDEEHPFKIFTPSGSLRVLGTRFQLEADVNDMRLVVVEGSVALAASGSEVQVGAGEMTRVRSGRVASIQQAPGLGELSSEWMGDFLVFQDTPLETAVTEIEELYGVDVEILDRSLVGKTLTMWFSSRPLEDVLTVVCSVIDAQCNVEGTQVTMGKRRDEVGG